MKKYIAAFFISSLVISTQASAAGDAGNRVIIPLLAAGTAITALYECGGVNPATHLGSAGICLLTFGRVCKNQALTKAGFGTWVAAISALVGDSAAMKAILPNVPLIGHQFDAAGALGQNIAGIGVFQLLWTILGPHVNRATSAIAGT